jgi:hypothetical protein
MTRTERIRNIFLKQRRFTRAQAADALGRSLRWVEESRFSRENGGWVSWQEMVLMANLLWTRIQIEKALGDDAVRVFPPLARLTTLSVRVPIYKVMGLRRDARRRHMDMGEIISDALEVDWCDAQSMDKTAPGVLEAWHFPYALSDSKGYREAADRRGGCPDD